jgi:trk system potassium uptake protein TrkA
MKVIIVGAGEVGFDIARLLAMEKHDVIVVDLDVEALDVVRDKLDVMTLRGNGTSTTLLQEAGVSGADLMIAVTQIDEVNIIACMIADRLGVPTTVARIRSDELSGTHAALKASDFGIDLVIHPEESAAAEIARLIRRASASDVLSFADDRIHLVGLRLEEKVSVIGKSLQDLAAENPNLTYRIMAIARGMRTVIPQGNEILHKNDQVFVLARPKVMPHIVRAMGKDDTRINDVMILGGTSVGVKVALHLCQERSKRVKLIEPKRAVAERIAELLPQALVIHGEGTDIDLLVQEGLGEMEAFVAVTDDEESNLVTCLLAKHLGVGKTIALLSKGVYVPISQTIGLDAGVSTKLAVSREVMRFLRGKHVLSVATVYGLDAEILEMQARRNAPITRSPLHELKLPRGMIIGAVMRGKEVEVATGFTHIEAGDRAIVFVLPRLVHQAEDWFAKG